MKNKKILFGLIALVAVVAVMVGIMIANQPKPKDPDTTTVSTSPSSTAPAYTKTITVTVVHGDGSEKVFTYHTNEAYLGAVLYAEGLIEESASSGMFDTADGEKADWSVDQGWWKLLIGEKMSTTGVDTTPISDGDSFKLVYTRG